MLDRHRLRRAFFAGLLLIVPLGVVVLLLLRAAELLESASRPVSSALGLHSTVAALAALVLAVLLVAAVAVLLGLALGAGLGAGLVATLRNTVFSRIPGYELVERLLGRVGEARDGAAYPPALVELHGPGAAQFCLVMERLADGRSVVFAPSSPAATVGMVHVVAPERITLLEGSALTVASIAGGWGLGAAKALGQALAEEGGAAASPDGGGAAAARAER